MTGDASRFFSVRMSIVLTLFAAVLLSGMMVPSIAFGEETGVGHEAGAVDGGTQASTEAHGAADQDEDDSGSGNPAKRLSASFPASSAVLWNFS